MIAKKIISVIILNLICLSYVFSEINDPSDFLNKELDSKENTIESDPDKNKSAEELLVEAFTLQQDERLLDARTKLLKVLQKNPKEFRAHMALASYYLVHVGHFRLALKYCKQALKLLIEKYGEPPYLDFEPQSYHADILNLISQSRLNLDDYEGALEPLTQFENYAYFSPFHASSKAWILMKQGKLQEAIKVARLGLIFGGNPGATENVLGILLSMTGERAAAINVFNKTIQYELALGALGQAATPLNNIGEVYRETFKEDLAEQSWKKAIALPDGCEHVLPSLNLAIIRMEKAEYDEASEAIDTFESCIAQYPLKNGEEHRALVKMARGRIALYKGDVDLALKYLNEANRNQQWFGKIGTSKEDLQTAVISSLAQALNAKNNFLKFTLSKSYGSWIAKQKLKLENSFKTWWYNRRALSLLTEDLNSLEDIYVRHTDSMLDYPSLGFLLTQISPRVLNRRIDFERKTDDRDEALIYYQTYLAENYLKHGRNSEAAALLSKVVNEGRPVYDRALRNKAIALLLTTLGESHASYVKFAVRLFELAKPALRLHGLRLPVSMHSNKRSINKMLSNAGFLDVNNNDCPFTVIFAEDKMNNKTNYNLFFKSDSPVIGNVKVTSDDLYELVNNFSRAVFVTD